MVIVQRDKITDVPEDEIIEMGKKLKKQKE